MVFVLSISISLDSFKLINERIVAKNFFPLIFQEISKENSHCHSVQILGQRTFAQGFSIACQAKLLAQLGTNGTQRVNDGLHRLFSGFARERFINRLQRQVECHAGFGRMRFGGFHVIEIKKRQRHEGT